MLAVLIGSTGMSYALPECPGSPTITFSYHPTFSSSTFNFANNADQIPRYNNCFGTKIYKNKFAASPIFMKLTGEWKNNKLHGKGSVTHPSGNKYVGEYKNGIRNGNFTVTYANTGDKYVGEFKDNTFNGHGKLQFYNGDYYEGEIIFFDPELYKK